MTDNNKFTWEDLRQSIAKFKKKLPNNAEMDELRPKVIKLVRELEKRIQDYQAARSSTDKH
jgi:preprotein translocase subunit SecA